jgi:adenine-specific DNA-methyltransferase
VLPIRQDESEGRWQWTPKTIRQRIKQGRVRITGNKENGFVVSVLKDGEFAKITRGEFKVSGARPTAR